MSARFTALAVLVAAVAVLLGCQQASGATADDRAEPQALDGHECAACAMIVDEQPSPRGQLVHRDGTRAHFCSIADMITYLEAPSPHGPATHVFVEAMPADAEDRLARDTSTRPWTTAKGAAFVTGFERERIMGTPYLTYASSADARRAADELGARVVGWDELVDR